MKLTSLFTVLGAATIFGLAVGVACAQTGQPAQASESGAQEAQKDLAPELNTEETAPAAPKGWKLPQPDCLKSRGIDMGGWVEQGITYNSLNPEDRYNGPNGCNDRAGEYQLNQAWLYFVKPTKTDGCGWDWGGRVDLSYGTDWRFGQCYGLETRIDDPNSFYGLVLPQFYGEVAYNDLTIKGGHFATFTSLEVIPAPLNFFYSHALLSCPYFDPVLVTGMQAVYKLNEKWTAVGGFNNGSMKFEDPDNTYNFLGGFKRASEDKRANLSVMVDAGPDAGFTGTHDRTNVITVYTYQITERFMYGSQYTAGIENHGSVVHPGDDASWYGTEQMFTYKLNDKWATGLRYEWVRDNDGSRVAGIGNALLTDKGWDGQPGCAGAYNDLSLGLNWRPNANCVLRPEARWDWYDGAANALDQLPYGNHMKREQFTLAMDCVITF
jgi:hypothetical protein